MRRSAPWAWANCRLSEVRPWGCTDREDLGCGSRVRTHMHFLSLAAPDPRRLEDGTFSVAAQHELILRGRDGSSFPVPASSPSRQKVPQKLTESMQRSKRTIGTKSGHFLKAAL